MPGGDPAMLEQLAAQLETAAQGAGTLADGTSQVTADVRIGAEWTGDAADSYTAFTGNLATGVHGTGAPLAQIAAAVREYAGSLRAAQQKVTAYATAAQTAQAARNSPASVASAELAGQDAATAVAGAAGRRGPGRRHGTGGQQGAERTRSGRTVWCGPGSSGWKLRGTCRLEMRSSAVIWPTRLAAARTRNWPSSSPRTCRS